MLLRYTYVVTSHWLEIGIFCLGRHKLWPGNHLTSCITLTKVKRTITSPYLSKMAGPGASKRIADMIRLYKQALTSLSNPIGTCPNITSNVRDDFECERMSPNGIAVDEYDNCIPETVAKTKKRGRTRGVKHVKKKKDGDIDDIQVPEELQRIVGDQAQHLITEAGVLVRSRAPLQVAKWKEIKDADKETLWVALKNKFKLEDNADNKVILAELEAMKVIQAETDAFLRSMFNQMNAPDFTMTESAPNNIE